jgi:similar to spore coat protein
MATNIRGLAPHEALDLHEMLSFKNVCLTKSKSMQALVSDDELKNILQSDVQMSAKQINELQGLLSKVQC